MMRLAPPHTAQVPPTKPTPGSPSMPPIARHDAPSDTVTSPLTACDGVVAESTGLNAADVPALLVAFTL